ncbi:MAG: hypothetical protein UY04_C0020G0019 [Parcubacteria group bacterium GW2011_GWA2_47_7]|nr:MAG: hypothetical protein UY04_C0020G0019 [Parcubacteria group bacterium GW2011_GWA2_47_7]
MSKFPWSIHAGRVLILILISMGALFFVEYATRSLVALEQVSTDPILGMRPSAGDEGDKRGFRNSATLATSSIVALGDSLVYGGNATREEAWPQVLGTFMSTSVYNMGMTGYSSVQVGYLFDQALSMKPDITIAGFYLGNSMQGAYDLVYGNEYWSHLRKTDSSEKEPSQSLYDDRIVLSMGIASGTFNYRLHQIGLWLREHSLAYARLADISRSLREKIGLASTSKDNAQRVLSLSVDHPDMVYQVKDKGIETILTPREELKAIDLSRTETKEGWRIAQIQYREMKRKAINAHSRFIILVLPSKKQVYQEYWINKDGEVPMEFKPYEDASEIQLVEVKRFCIDEEIECIFPLSQMSVALKDGKRIYSNSQEGHPLPEGYRIIAETIAEYLNENPTR